MAESAPGEKSAGASAAEMTQKAKKEKPKGRRVSDVDARQPVSADISPSRKLPGPARSPDRTNRLTGRKSQAATDRTATVARTPSSSVVKTRKDRRTPQPTLAADERAGPDGGDDAEVEIRTTAVAGVGESPDERLARQREEDLSDDDGESPPKGCQSPWDDLCCCFLCNRMRCNQLPDRDEKGSDTCCCLNENRTCQFCGSDGWKAECADYDTWCCALLVILVIVLAIFLLVFAIQSGDHRDRVDGTEALFICLSPYSNATSSAPFWPDRAPTLNGVELRMWEAPKSSSWWDGYGWSPSSSWHNALRTTLFIPSTNNSTAPMTIVLGSASQLLFQIEPQSSSSSSSERTRCPVDGTLLLFLSTFDDNDPDTVQEELDRLGVSVIQQYDPSAIGTFTVPVV